MFKKRFETTLFLPYLSKKVIFCQKSSCFCNKNTLFWRTFVELWYFVINRLNFEKIVIFCDTQENWCVVYKWPKISISPTLGKPHIWIFHFFDFWDSSFIFQNGRPGPPLLKRRFSRKKTERRDKNSWNRSFMRPGPPHHLNFRPLYIFCLNFLRFFGVENTKI